MADETIRTWDLLANGDLTIEVVDKFGAVTETHVVSKGRLEDMRQRGVRILRPEDVLEELRSNKIGAGLKPSPSASPPIAPAVPWAPPVTVSAPPPAAPVAAPASPPPTTGGGPVADPPKTERPKRSCIECPNFLTSNEVPRRYGKAIGTPMCKFFDKPLGRASHSPQQQKLVFEKVGTACDAYGKEANDRPKRAFAVAFPDMRLTNEDNVDPALRQACSSCQSCRNFTPDDIVMSELGWVAGLCNAKGTLVQAHSTTFVGRTCDIRQFGEVRNTATVGLNLFPEYADDFLTGDVIAAFKKANAFNPRNSETDKPVSDEDREFGIRAWKKVIDKERPEFDTGVFLPVFNPEFFTEVERSKIPQSGDDEHPEMYVDHANAVYKMAVLWQELDETPAIWGEAGNGKTELFRYLAWMMQLPFERISITASTELDDLAGKMHYDPAKGTYFLPGRLPKAWHKPAVLCLDEPNVGAPDVWQFIRPLTDNSKQLVLDMNEGERITRHLYCYLGMAMNPAWDPRNVGANPIGDADQRRLMHIFMPPPPREIEEEIIRERCKVDGYEIPKVMLNTVMQTAAELRGLSQQGAIPVTWGVAPQIKVARATRWFSLIDAYKIAVTDFLEPSQAEVVLAAVRANAPASLIGGSNNNLPPF